MISLTYLSTATDSFDPAGLRDLLLTAREKNDAADVTGMLLYAEGHFIQTLEGPEQAVDAIFARIVGDPQHRDVIVALREEIDSRAFADWSMGFESLSAEEASALPGFTDYLAGRTMSQGSGRALGRPGIFHRVFRDRMRPNS